MLLMPSSSAHMLVAMPHSSSESALHALGSMSGLRRHQYWPCVDNSTRDRAHFLLNETFLPVASDHSDACNISPRWLERTAGHPQWIFKKCGRCPIPRHPCCLTLTLTPPKEPPISEGEIVALAQAVQGVPWVVLQTAEAQFGAETKIAMQEGRN